MMDTFSRPLFLLFKVLYEFCQFRIIFFRFFAFVPILKLSSPTNFPDAEMGVNVVYYLKTEVKWHFKRCFCFYLGLKLTLVSVSIDKDVVAPNCVNKVCHIAVAF